MQARGIVPQELKLGGSSNAARGIDSTKKYRKFFPQHSGVFSTDQNNTLQIDISSEEFLMLSEARIRANVKYQGSVEAYSADANTKAAQVAQDCKLSGNVASFGVQICDLLTGANAGNPDGDHVVEIGHMVVILVDDHADSPGSVVHGRGMVLQLVGTGQTGVNTASVTVLEPGSGYKPGDHLVIDPAKGLDLGNLWGARALKLTLGNTVVAANTAVDPHYAAAGLAQLTQSVQLDCGLMSMIETLIIKAPDGTELERIEDYNLLHALLDDYRQTDQEHDKHRVSEFLESANLSAKSSPMDDLSLASAVSIPVEGQRALSSKIYGSFFQSHQKKMLPPGVSFSVHMQFCDAKAAGKYCGRVSSPKLEWSDVYMIIPSVQVNDLGFNQTTMRLRDSGYMFFGETYRRFVNTIGADTDASTQIQVPVRCASLNGMITIIRPDTYTNNAQRHSLASKSIRHVKEYSANVGSEMYPPQPVKLQIFDQAISYKDKINRTDFSEAFQQVVATLGAPTFEPTKFTRSWAGDGRGVICLDLAPYHKSDMQAVAGVDTKTNAIPVMLNLTMRPVVSSSGYAPTNRLTLTTFAKCTMAFQIQANAIKSGF